MPAPDRHRTRCLGRGTLGFGRWALALACTACIVPAPTGDPIVVGPPTILLQKDKLDPQVHLEKVIDVKQNPILNFKIEEGGVVQLNSNKSLFFFWYYDYDPKVTNILEAFRICSFDTRSCNVNVCNKPKTLDDKHNLLVVVADGRTVENPSHAFDFPPGVAFDSAEWRIRLVGGDCPK